MKRILCMAIAMACAGAAFAQVVDTSARPLPNPTPPGQGATVVVKTSVDNVAPSAPAMVRSVLPLVVASSGTPGKDKDPAPTDPPPDTQLPGLPDLPLEPPPKSDPNFCADLGVSAQSLAKGVQYTGKSGATGSSTLYKVVIPANSIALSLRTLGGTGDTSVYIGCNQVPTPQNTPANFRAVHAGTNSESVPFTYPNPGTYYMLVYGEKAYAGVTILATWTEK